MDCARIAADEMAERYAAGHLTGAEREAFELHYFDCPECLAEVRALQLSRQALEQDEALRGDLPAPRRSRVQWFWWTALAAAAALAIVAIRLQWSEPVQPAVEPAVSAESPQEVIGPEDSPAEPAIVAEAPDVDILSEAAREDEREMLLASLAMVEPPPYERVILRGVADEASRQFDKGMASYLGGDFEAAVGPLRLAATSDVDRPDIGFYYGASLLLTGSTEEAIGELSRVVNLGDPVFSEEARFYLAKAYLRSGKLEKATEEFRLVVGASGPFAAEAAEILRQLAAFR